MIIEAWFALTLAKIDSLPEKASFPTEAACIAALTKALSEDKKYTDEHPAIAMCIHGVMKQ